MNNYPECAGFKNYPRGGSNNRTLTKRQINKLSPKRRLRLLRLLIDSFEEARVTGLYSSEAEVIGKQVTVVKIGCRKGWLLNIETDICSG